MQFPQRDRAAVRPRVANGRVAASRARLHDGHEAPLPRRPRARAGRAILSAPRSLAVRGRARRSGCMSSFGGRRLSEVPARGMWREMFEAGLPSVVEREYRTEYTFGPPATA